MYPQTHFLFSYLVALIFVKFGVFDYRVALLVGLVGMLVDVDHYLVFLGRYRYKDFSLKDAWNRAVKGFYAGRSFIHHEIGFVLVSAIIIGLFFWNKNLFWIFGLGYYTHLIMDFGHFNILKIREKMKFKEAGFVMKINKFEVLLDIFLAIGIILLVL